VVEAKLLGKNGTRASGVCVCTKLLVVRAEVDCVSDDRHTSRGSGMASGGYV